MVLGSNPTNPLHGVESCLDLLDVWGRGAVPGIHYMELKDTVDVGARALTPTESITWSWKLVSSVVGDASKGSESITWSWKRLLRAQYANDIVVVKNPLHGVESSCFKSLASSSATIIILGIHYMELKAKPWQRLLPSLPVWIHYMELKGQAGSRGARGRRPSESITWSWKNVVCARRLPCVDLRESITWSWKLSLQS